MSHQISDDRFGVEIQEACGNKQSSNNDNVYRPPKRRTIAARHYQSRVKELTTSHGVVSCIVSMTPVRVLCSHAKLKVEVILCPPVTKLQVVNHHTLGVCRAYIMPDLHFVQPYSFFRDVLLVSGRVFGVACEDLCRP
jgi:hypothetical protein